MNHLVTIMSRGLFVVMLTFSFFSCQEDEISLNSQESNSEVSPDPIITSTLSDYNALLLWRGVSNSSIYDGYSNTGLGGWSFPGALGNGNTTGGGIEATVFNNKAYAAYKGNANNQIYLTYSSDGDYWQAPLNLGSSYLTQKDLGLKGFDSKLWIALTYNNSSDVYIGHSSNGLSWSVPSFIGLGSSHSVDLVVWGNSLYVLLSSMTGNQIKMVKADGYQRGLNTGGFEAGAPTGVVFNETLYIFFPRISNNSIYYAKVYAGSHTITQLPVSNSTTANKITAEVVGDKLIIMFKGADTNDVKIRYTTDGTNWSSYGPAIQSSEGPALLNISSITP